MHLIDFYGLITHSLLLSPLQTATFLVYNALTSSKLTFALATMSIYFTLGGCFAMFPPLTQQVFGSRNGKSPVDSLITTSAE